VDGRVDLAVAAAIEAVTVGRPELAGIGAIRAARASVASVAKRSAPASRRRAWPRLSGSQPRSATTLGATWAITSAISISSALMVSVSSRTRRSSSRAMRARIVRSARAKRGAILLVHFFDNNAPAGNASPGPRSRRFHSSVPLSATRVRTRRSR